MKDRTISSKDIRTIELPDVEVYEDTTYESILKLVKVGNKIYLSILATTLELSVNGISFAMKNLIKDGRFKDCGFQRLKVIKAGSKRVHIYERIK